ncbi:acyl-CoA thioesterase [Priestia megaterium]|uniref:acyl-CoA thioesterase n=1 Tax=Priestia megaterium TaxID=1404 RepID=UPI002DBFFF1D|nr:thioesterase family protein [Priestia megaterium]MEC1066773.1 thioesterase family protein [Priestia megaterium]
MNNISYIEDMDHWKESFSFKQEIKVRFSETDMFGHLNNTVPFVYFEQIRTEFFYHIGFMQKWTSEHERTIPVVADLQCDYVKQVYFGNVLSVFIKAHRIGRSSVDLHYMIQNEQREVVLIGRGTMVQISKETGKSVPWDEEMKRSLSNI